MAPGSHLATVCVPSRLRMVGLLQVGYGRPLPPRLIRNVCVAGLAHYPANGVLLTAYLSARAAADIVVSLRRFLSTTLATYGCAHAPPRVPAALGADVRTHARPRMQCALPDRVGPRAGVRAASAGRERRLRTRPL